MTEDDQSYFYVGKEVFELKRKMISLILIGSLSAMCLYGCGSNSGSEKETQTVTEAAESSNDETEEENLAGSSDEAENDGDDSGTAGADDSSQNTDAAGAENSSDTDVAGDNGQNTDAVGTDGASGSTDTADSQNTSAGTADSDALDVSWGVIGQYGFNDRNESNLSFGLKGSTLIDCGGFYTIEATFYKPVLISLNHEVGDIVEIVTNELTGERCALTYKGNGTFVDADNIDYHAADASSSEPVELYYFSDDRVETAFYEGIISIAADAESCIDITDEKTVVSAELLSEDSWYNGVLFNDKNQAVTLTIYGD